MSDSITFLCVKRNYECRNVLRWMAGLYKSLPYTALLKGSVLACQFTKINPKASLVDDNRMRLTFVMDSEVSKRSMEKYLARVKEAIREGYREQWDLELVEINVMA